MDSTDDDLEKSNEPVTMVSVKMLGSPNCNNNNVTNTSHHEKDKSILVAVNHESRCKNMITMITNSLRSINLLLYLYKVRPLSPNIVSSPQNFLWEPKFPLGVMWFFRFFLKTWVFREIKVVQKYSLISRFNLGSNSVIIFGISLHTVSTSVSTWCQRQYPHSVNVSLHTVSTSVSTQCQLQYPHSVNFSLHTVSTSVSTRCQLQSPHGVLTPWLLWRRSTVPGVAIIDNIRRFIKNILIMKSVSTLFFIF